MSGGWVKEFQDSLDEWDGDYIITSPDIDGILSACLLGDMYDAKLIGIYTTRYLILFDDISDIDVKRALWLDHDISHEGIQCMGQHLVDHSKSDNLPKRGKNSFNPNNYFKQTWKDSFHGSNMKKGKRDKYPYATIHFLMHGLGIPDPDEYSTHFHLLAHADGSWATCVDYKENTKVWWGEMFPCNGFIYLLNSGYTNDSKNLIGHTKMVNDLIELGIAKRSSRSSPSSLIPDDWIKLQGKQSISYRKNIDPQVWLSKFNKILEYVVLKTNWNIKSPKLVSSMHRGLILEVSNRGDINEGDFDQFMFDEDIFSHAITGAGTMRFTKKISIDDTIDSYEEIYRHQSLFL